MKWTRNSLFKFAAAQKKCTHCGGTGHTVARKDPKEPISAENPIANYNTGNCKFCNGTGNDPAVQTVEQPSQSHVPTAEEIAKPAYVPDPQFSAPATTQEMQNVMTKFEKLKNVSKSVPLRKTIDEYLDRSIFGFRGLCPKEMQLPTSLSINNALDTLISGFDELQDQIDMNGGIWSIDPKKEIKVVLHQNDYVLAAETVRWLSKDLDTMLRRFNDKEQERKNAINTEGTGIINPGPNAKECNKCNGKSVVPDPNYRIGRLARLSYLKLFASLLHRLDKL